MSLRLFLTERLFRSSIEKNLYALIPADMYMEAARQNKDREFDLPKNRDAVYEAVKLAEGSDCLKITQKGGSQKALLYLYEGALLLPDESDLQMAVNLGKQSGRDVYLPYYPILPDKAIDDMLDAVMACYKLMSDTYGASNVAIVGIGIGATLGIVMHLLTQKMDLALEPAEKIIAISPQVIVYDMDLLADMVRMDPRDVRRDSHYTDFLTTNAKVWGEDRYEAKDLFTGLKGDYKALPETWFYYGSEEVLSVTAQQFEISCKEAGIPYHMTIEKGMMHAYPALTFTPEGKKAFAQIVGLLK